MSFPGGSSSLIVISIDKVKQIPENIHILILSTPEKEAVRYSEIATPRVIWITESPLPDLERRKVLKLLTKNLERKLSAKVRKGFVIKATVQGNIIDS